MHLLRVSPTQFVLLLFRENKEFKPKYQPPTVSLLVSLFQCHKREALFPLNTFFLASYRVIIKYIYYYFLVEFNVELCELF